MPDTTKKISELASITAAGINSADILVVTDVSESTSSKITFENVTNAILSDANIEAKAPTFVTKLNAINSSVPSVSNGLNAGGLYYNEQYRDGAYFLNWNNVTSKPAIPADINDLTNAGNFVSYDTASSKIRVKGTGTNLATDLTITSDYVDEGINNLFYTDARVQNKVNTIFGGLFNQYSDTFDSGNVIDSLVDVSATFQGVNAFQSSVVRVSDVTLASHFAVGQSLRLYGASDTADLIQGTPNPSISVQGQAGFGEGTSSNHRVMAYKFCYFNLKDGRIGSLTQVALTKNVQYTADGGSTYTDPLPRFNTDNFVKFTGLSAGTDNGILVYRSIDSGPFKLLAVLGPKNFDGGVWQDYHLFDYTTWGGKDSSDNTYSTITHFPLTEHSAQQRGWLDVSIKSIDIRSSYFDITLGDNSTDTTTSVYCNPAPSVVAVAHNDTSKINEAIQSRSASGNKSVQLNGKTYMASHLSIPDNFGIVGTANITKIKKLPWSGYNGDNADGSLLKSQTISNANTLSLYGLDLDGNITNQYLVNDGADKSLNFLVDFGTAPIDVLIDRCRVQNVVAGGIYADSPTNMRITTSEIKNSGVSDVHAFSPLYATGGSNTLLTSNRFLNFADSIDVSVTSEAMVASNIVKACGSGLLVAGSTFMVSSPNVLIGAANEFLSSPDILNTEYDSINIPLDKFVNSGDYLSDSYVYQENGAAFDLSKTSIASENGTIVYRLNLIQQLSNGSTLPYAVDAGTHTSDLQHGPSISFLAADVDTGSNHITITGHEIPNGSRVLLAGVSLNALGAGTDGEYFAKVTGNDIELFNSYTAPSTFGSQQGLSTQANGTLKIVPAPSIPFINGKRYKIKDVGTGVNWTSIGAQVGLVDEYFIYNGGAVTGTNGVASAEDFAGLNNQLPPVITDMSKTSEERQAGEFQFKVLSADKNLLYTGAFSPSQLQQRYDARVTAGTSGYPAGSKHLGVAWSANYRYFADVGSIVSGLWYVYQAGADTTLASGNKTTAISSLQQSPQYRVIVDNPVNITVGMEVTIKNSQHTGFTTSGGLLSSNANTAVYARVTAIANVDGQPTQKLLTLTYYNLLGTNAGATDGVTSVNAGHIAKGSNGTGKINTVDDFVIAQGLIK